MSKIIFYKLNGIVKKMVDLTEENLKQCNGMKLKCYLNDNSEIVGFADVFRTHDKNEFDNEVHGYINLWTFDNLDEEQHKLVGENDNRYNQTFKKINIEDIIKVEAILYSNPRWGTKLTNKFELYPNDSDDSNESESDVEIPSFLKK